MHARRERERAPAKLNNMELSNYYNEALYSKKFKTILASRHGYQHQWWKKYSNPLLTHK